MSRKKKMIGIGAVASVLLRMLHPSAAIGERYSNPDHGHRHQGLLPVCCEIKKVNNHEQMTLVMRHDNFEGVELYYLERFLRIEAEGAAEYFFTATAPINNEEEENDVERVPEDVIPFLGGDRVNVIDAIHLAAVLPTDDDNEPAPENIPEADQPPPPQGQWGHNNICDRKATGIANTRASLQIPRELPMTLF